MHSSLHENMSPLLSRNSGSKFTLFPGLSHVYTKMAGNNHSDDEFFQQYFGDSSSDEEFEGFQPGSYVGRRITEPFFQMLEDASLPCDEELGWKMGEYDHNGNLLMPEQPLLSLPFTGKCSSILQSRFKAYLIPCNSLENITRC